MDCLPAIDIRGGRAVRLQQGEFARETVFGDPLERALDLVAAGARALHVVDLDAARTGEPVNREVVQAIVARAGVPVQVAGGARRRRDVAELLGGGAWRVVLGSAALEDPALVWDLARRWPGRIAVGLDHRRRDGRRELAVHGWETPTTTTLEEALAAFAAAPLGAVVVTDITRDGTLGGPDLEGYRLALALSELPIVASGGIATRADLEALAALRAGGRGLAGAIVGRAILTGAISVAEAVAACGA
ncbi:MAG TPA: HisA/HisF-related TIM barrel protein [Acidimicrobiales bacterium]|jgi:phosphoribosylformimino-5-aminoimidazole carboxamide ribotide isomerase|nr:HisA/HisF-related TIM barrel protein [Acidimicrobiales bacterium]